MTAGSLLTDRHTGTWAQEPLGSGVAHFRFPKAFKRVLYVFVLKIIATLLFLPPKFAYVDFLLYLCTRNEVQIDPK